MPITRTNWTTDRKSQTLEVYLLGLVDFEAALFLQERFVYEVSGRDDRFGVLLLCEHPPLVTVGREGSHSHLLSSSEELTARQIAVHWLRRGGGCLVHGPGQLAVYPIVPLQRLGIGLSDYGRRLEESVIETSHDFKVPSFRRDRAKGVWTRTGQFAFLGAAVKSWVSYHGLFVNVCPDLSLIRIAQSNSTDGRITSLEAQRQRRIPMHAVREGLARRIAEQLGYEHTHVYSGHPLLRRTRRRIHAYV